MTTTTDERRRIFAVATRTQRLLDELRDTHDQGDAELLAICVEELQARADVELLACILDRHDQQAAAAERRHEAHEQRFEENRRRAEQEAQRAAAVDCPTCHQAAGEPCLTLKSDYPRPRAPHAARVAASDQRTGEGAS